MQKGVLRNFIKLTRKRLCQGLFFNKVARPRACNFIKKEALAEVFSCEFYEISKNTFSYRTPAMAASEAWEMGSSKKFLSNFFGHW